jgi:phosphoenolpyruvate-protein phosphotransferase (PTS system enzyme I)
VARVSVGTGVSPGVAVGTVSLLDPASSPPRERLLPAGRLPAAEVEAFRQARQVAREELRVLQERLSSSLGASYGAILDAQVLLVDDPALVDDAERRIREERVTAAWAVHAVLSGYLERFAAIDDGYLRDRGADLKDLERRLLRALSGPGGGGEVPLPPGPTILVGHTIGPSDAVALAREGIVGLAADLGGPTSHTAILAKAFGVPAVVGLGDLATTAGEGETLLVDGDQGLVIVDPSRAEIEQARRRADASRLRESTWVSARDLPAVTRDGVEITLRANVEFLEEAAAAVRFGADGIGLYRSEFLFVAHAPDLPTEEEQLATYRELASRVAPHPVVIRTLDLGGEKYFHDVLERAEPNPVLGLRGLRLCLRRPELFRPQLRALLRAATDADVRVLLPVVTTPAEVREVRRLLQREAEDLAAQGIACRPDVPLGAMIETPAAAGIADLLARETDFLSVGTNDLIQYALAVDRGNPSVASLYDPLHPAILRMLRAVVRAAASRGVPVSLCGEMAADPALVPVLVGLGFRELSCPPRAVPPVRDAVRALFAADSARWEREQEA